jgi:hypothetical protein
MADPAWPAGIPHEFLRDDFAGAEPHLPPLETEMEGGVVRMRRRFSKAVATVQASIYLSDTQFETFRVWVRDTLLHGTQRFTVPIYVTTGYATKTCQLVGGTYKWARMGVGWKVSLALRVEDW